MRLKPVRYHKRRNRNRRGIMEDEVETGEVS